MEEFDFLIVGQGLAGSLLAYELWQRGATFKIFDQNTEWGHMSSSQIAAGIINPITGKRFVKSWRIDEFLPKAKATYQKIEYLLAIRLWHDRTLIRTIHTIEEENSYLLRKTYPEYADYCGDLTPSVSEAFKNFHAFAEIKQAAQVNLPLLINRFQEFFNDLDVLVKAKFQFDDLKIDKSKVHYHGYTAAKIIFCEGANAAQNPYFNWLPFNLDKGELLLVDIPNLNLSQIFKNKISIIPLSDTEGGAKDRYWVGATNDWTFENALPTESNRQLIINELQDILKRSFTVVAHLVAIRPTVRDRRPLIGFHPKFPNLAIFNGFGTKGASLAPYWASHFADVLLEEKKLDIEAAIVRFKYPV